jgi:hypothetical protein
MLFKVFSILVFLCGLISIAVIYLGDGFKISRNAPNGEGFGKSNEAPMYLLVSTSSKIYCLNISNEQTPPPFNQKQQKPDYDVLYEHKERLNNWITDLFYVKYETIIYANVYNNTSATSEIFTLKYDQLRHQWIKNVLYINQSYCLGKFALLINQIMIQS